MKILCDQMLGTLAKWLRLFGFDVFYANDKLSDDELLQIALKEKRVIISRDKELIIRGKKKNLITILIKTTDIDEQLCQILKISPIDENTVLSRCNLCNTVLEQIDKSSVEEFVPKKIFENNKDFWYCNKCKKYYWKGSHYNKIIEKIDEIKKKTK